LYSSYSWAVVYVEGFAASVFGGSSLIVGSGVSSVIISGSAGYGAFGGGVEAAPVAGGLSAQLDCSLELAPSA